jgi:RND family efflux transporter MFP subunit
VPELRRSRCRGFCNWHAARADFRSKAVVCGVGVPRAKHPRTTHEETTMTHSSLPLLAMTLVPLLASCSVKEAAAQKPRVEAAAVGNVKTDTAKSKPVATTVPLTGTLKANRESALAADVTGRVIAVHVERGSRVKKGDVVAQIDRRGAQFALAEAGAHVAAARTHSAQANLECRRAEKLFAGRAISEAEYQATQSQCEAAEHSLTAAAVKSQLAQKAVGDAVIRAPFDAVVAERFVNPGEFVNFDSRVAVLVELERLRLELSVRLPQRDLRGPRALRRRERAARDTRPLGRSGGIEPRAEAATRHVRDR